VGPLTEVVLGGDDVVAQLDRLGLAERGVLRHERIVVDAEALLDECDRRVGGDLELVGHEELVAVPGVRDRRLGEVAGQLGLLVEAPTAEVVVDPDDVGVVRVPVVGHGARRYPWPTTRLKNAPSRAYSSTWCSGWRNPWPSPG